MNSNTNISLTVEAWADIVIKEWIKKVEALNIGNTGLLVNSFVNTIYTAANGDPGRIVFAFEYYGRFVDYGVGRYVRLDDRDGMIAAGLTRRRPKQFFSDTFYKQLEILRHLLEEKYLKKLDSLVVRNYNDNADYGYKTIDL